MKKPQFRIKQVCTAALLLAVLLCCLAPTAFGAQLPDLEQKGTISIALKPGHSLTLYRAGKPSLTDGDYSWQLTPDFAGSGLDLSKLTGEKLPADLLRWAEKQKLTGMTRQADEKGVIVFRDLEPGLYLLSQKKAVEGYYPVAPFLVTLPQKGKEGWLYQVDARPKTELEQKPGPTPPPKPDEPHLPQTGQTNWPVPVLAIIGLTLFVCGWSLYYEKGRGER